MIEQRPPKMALLLAFGAVVFHTVACFYEIGFETATGYLFRLEFFFFVGISAVCALLSPFIGALKGFITIHAIRAVSVVISFSILSGSSPAAYLLISIPFVLETATYLENRIGIVTNVIFIILGAIINFVGINALEPINALKLAGYPALILMVFAAIGSLLITFRERIVENTRDIRDLNAAVQNLSSANKSFQLYADNVESESANRERNRITRELHDVVGYALTNITMLMNAGKVLAVEDSEKLPELLETTRRQADEALQETRSTLYRLRAVQDGKPKGIQAFSHLVRAFEGATGVRTELNYGNLPSSLGAAIDGAIYRLIQEGLTNAFRHGRAEAVRVNLWHADGAVTVSIWDNGKGAAKIDDGIGLRGMRERFASLGGSIHAENVVDGFEIRGMIPCNTAQGRVMNE